MLLQVLVSQLNQNFPFPSMAAALGIQGNMGGFNASFKVRPLGVQAMEVVLMLYIGQGEAHGCAQCQHHGC